jgi:hypothetical protein
MRLVAHAPLPSRFAQLRTECQFQYLFRRELHPVRLERVPLDARNELRFVVGADLETAVALK